MKNSIYSVLRTCALACLAASFAASATQVIQPFKDETGTAFGGVDTAWTGTAALGSVVTIVGRYTTTGNANESGLGLKILYDETKFTGVTVSALTTKCMIAAPQIQPGGASSKAVLGWIDTAARGSATVGWPYAADPPTFTGSPATSPCLNPNAPQNDTSAIVPGAVNLFRFQGTLANVAVGSNTSVTISADGNVSYASTSPGMASQVVTITAAAAASCNLDADGNGGVLDGFSDGILILRYLLGIGNQSLQTGVTPNMPRNTPALVRAYLDTQNLAVVSPTTPDGFVDGIVILRLMLGIGNQSLLNGVTLPAGAPTTAAAVRAQVNARCGTTF